MIIEDYFQKIETAVKDSLIVHSSSLNYDKRSTHIGFIGEACIFSLEPFPGSLTPAGIGIKGGVGRQGKVLAISFALYGRHQELLMPARVDKSLGMGPCRSAGGFSSTGQLYPPIVEN